MTDSRGRALTYTALVELKNALDRSTTPEDFLAEADAIIGESDNLLELPFDTETPEALAAGSPGESGRDVDNAPLVYEFLGALDRANASDRRLWTYLALDTYREYMEQRWPLVGVRNWKGRAETRWLMLNATRGRLVRHGISRLWWIASLTYDAGCQYPLSKLAGNDPFAYTRAVLQNEDRVNALFDREAGAIPALVRAVLEHAANDEAKGTDDYIRALMKELTLVYGYRDVAVLDDHGLEALVVESAPRLSPVV